MSSGAMENERQRWSDIGTWSYEEELDWEKLDLNWLKGETYRSVEVS